MIDYRDVMSDQEAADIVVRLLKEAGGPHDKAARALVSLWSWGFVSFIHGAFANILLRLTIFVRLNLPYSEVVQTT